MRAIGPWLCVLVAVSACQCLKKTGGAVVDASVIDAGHSVETVPDAAVAEVPPEPVDAGSAVAALVLPASEDQEPPTVVLSFPSFEPQGDEGLEAFTTSCRAVFTMETMTDTPVQVDECEADLDEGQFSQVCDEGGEYERKQTHTEGVIEDIWDTCRRGIGSLCKAPIRRSCESCREQCASDCRDCKAVCRIQPDDAGLRDAAVDAEPSFESECLTSCAQARLECRTDCGKAQVAAREACRDTIYRCEETKKLEVLCPDCDEVRDCLVEKKPKQCRTLYPKNAVECLEWCSPSIDE